MLAVSRVEAGNMLKGRAHTNDGGNRLGDGRGRGCGHQQRRCHLDDLIGVHLGV